jgi:hypothetical protein
VLSNVYCPSGKLTVSQFGKLLKADFPLTSVYLKSHNSQQSSARKSDSHSDSERPSFKSLHKSEYVRNTASTQRETIIKSENDQKPIDARRYDAFISTIEYDFDDSRDESDKPQYKFYDLYRGRSTERERKFLKGTRF